VPCPRAPDRPDADLVLPHARATLILSPRPELNGLEERPFMVLAASNLSASAHFQLPPDRVVELGVQLEI
jgi:K+ transporter